MSDKTAQFTKKYWNSIGERNDARWHVAHRNDLDDFMQSGKSDFEMIFQNGLDFIPPNGSIMELGCGPGRIARWVALARPDARVFGLDVSKSLIAQAWEINNDVRNLNFIIGDGVSIEWACDNFIDMIYSYIVIQHLPRHVAAQYFDEVLRILKPGGIIKFQVQTRDAVQEVDPPWNDFRSIRYYTPTQAQNLLPSGFTMIEESGTSNSHSYFITAKKEMPA